MTIENEKLEMVEILKGARKCSLNQTLEHEKIFFEIMKLKFPKEQLVKETESRLRDLYSVFADACNTTFPEEKQLNAASIGFIQELLDRYEITVVISKK